MSDGPISMKCPKCGLDNSREPICKISGKELQIFDDFDPGEIVDKSIHRVQVWCDELDDSFDADVSPDHNFSYMWSAVSVYVEQIGLDEDALEWVNLRIRGRWVDGLAYDQFYIGSSFAQCVQNLDKAAAGEPFGKPLSDWDVD